MIMAMEAEALPVIDALGAVETDGAPPLPVRLFTARVGACEAVVAINGRDGRHGVDSIGTDAATLTTYEVARRFRPELLISAGTAGGWQSRGAAIGDVYLSRDRFVHHDRRIAIPGWDDYGVGSYPAFDATEMAARLNLKQGLVTTSNSLDENDDDRLMIARNGGDVKEMEAAAVAHVGELMGIPVLAVKAITDLVDHHTATAEQFATNLTMATARLTTELLRVIDHLGSVVVGNPTGSP
ncbi:MAG: 5'-methylthioadenosine nucleosidase [Acidimicrobiia bacterium]|nr:5'-methylthioadenosine nucleosidase [Acidimicrobiia bacterium]